MNKVFTAEKMRELDAKYEYYRKNPDASRRVCMERKMDTAPRVISIEEYRRIKARRRRIKNNKV